MAGKKSNVLSSLARRAYGWLYEQVAGRPPPLPEKCPTCHKRVDEMNMDPTKRQRICQDNWHSGKLIEEILY